jgi:4'-phosphopantetheinyl transferase
VSLSLSLYRLDGLPPELLVAARDWLEPAQRIRADRFVTATLRRRFLAAQTRLRQHLGERLGISPERLVVYRDAHGKPHLAEEHGLHFSLSHSGEWALVAAAQVPVGVDIEADIAGHRADLAEQFLEAATFRAWQALEVAQRGEALTLAWCAREALLKLDGRGLALNLRSIDLPLALPDWGSWEHGAQRGWVQPLVAPAGFRACLASREPAELPGESAVDASPESHHCNSQGRKSAGNTTM